MKSYKSGTQVEYGIYLSAKALDVRFVGADGESLDGKSGAQYFRLPTILAIAAAPVIGAVFVMSFPVIVIAMVIGAILKGFVSMVTEAARDRAHLVNMQWQPSASYLKGKKNAATSEHKTEADPELKKLEAEAQARKKEE